MQLNSRKTPIYTHEGGKAKRISHEQELKRSIMSCLLWEDTFYESGVDISKRIAGLIPKVEPLTVALLANEAKHDMKLRHIPLFIAIEMLKHEKHKGHVSELLSSIITRADELAEVLAMYWKDGRKPIASQLRKGLAKAWTKFDEYSLAKYNKDKEVKLKDSLFLSHAKPINSEQNALWKRLINGTLKTPDTWEVSLGKEDKKQTWERLITERKLGSLAFIRNLRNFQQENVPNKLIREGLNTLKVGKLLPFQILNASAHAKSFEPELERLLLESTDNIRKIKGETAIVLDVSWSMSDRISSKSDMSRLHVASSLGIIAREIFEHPQIFTFSNRLVEVPLRKGFALSEAIMKSQPYGGTELAGALQILKQNFKHDRMLVITDEQIATGRMPNVCKKQYMINVGTYENGIGYHDWIHIDGWSENVIKYIAEIEG